MRTESPGATVNKVSGRASLPYSVTGSRRKPSRMLKKYS
jgi:hypothetical protein